MGRHRSTLLLALLLLPGCSAAPGLPPATLPDRIELQSPLPGTVITSPLAIHGRARGSWYFEASFPVYLLNAAGDTIARSPAHAQGEWMTADFVPFDASLSFATTASGSGTLVLAKDDPSGMASLTAELRIPIRFR